MVRKWCYIERLDFATCGYGPEALEEGALAKSSPSRYVDRSIYSHAVVTEASRPSVRQCLVGSISGQLRPFPQRQARYAGLDVPFSFPAVLGVGTGVLGGLVASSYAPFPVPVIVGGLLFGLVVASQRILDAVSARWASPKVERQGRALEAYEEMARKELYRKEALYGVNSASEGVLDRLPSVDAWFPSRTVWAMEHSGNGVAQFAAERLTPSPFLESRANLGVAEEAFSQCDKDLWEACEDACGEEPVGVLEVGGRAHAVFTGELRGLPDADLLDLSSYVVRRHEVERKIEVLNAKIERAKAEGADDSYPEVAGAAAELEVLREQSERIGEAYQDRLTLAKNDDEVAQLTERERRKIERQEQALRDLNEPFDDD